MIINTGCRTDIPAFYSEWFFNRIREGLVLVRNPYYPEQILKYRLNPDVVDALSFCTKNPEPMLARMNEIKQYNQFWFVTITPYGKEIEPNVPDKIRVMESFKRLSNIVGVDAIQWRYDPIFITDKYSIDFHINSFEKMAKNLQGYVNSCVVSFIDLYEKTKRNFPGVRAVTIEQQAILAKEFVKIGKKYGISIRSCCEGKLLEKYGVNIDGCITKEIMEKAIGCALNIPNDKKSTRDECNCLLGNDIGMYNTCNNGCIYCYANYDRKTVVRNMKLHDNKSPILVGHININDKVKDDNQESYSNGQLSFWL